MLPAGLTWASCIGTGGVLSEAKGQGFAQGPVHINFASG